MRMSVSKPAFYIRVKLFYKPGRVRACAENSKPACRPTGIAGRPKFVAMLFQFISYHIQMCPCNKLHLRKKSNCLEYSI